MFQKIFSFALIVSVLSAAPSAFAGKFELTTYYPAPYGEYKELKASDSVEVGTNAAPGTFKLVDGNQALGKVLVSDANGVGTWQANSASPAGWTCGTITVTRTFTADYQVLTALCPSPRKPIWSGAEGWFGYGVTPWPVQSGDQFGVAVSNQTGTTATITLHALCCE